MRVALEKLRARKVGRVDRTVSKRLVGPNEKTVVFGRLPFFTEKERVCVLS